MAACGRHGDLNVSALDSRSRGPGLSPGRVIVLCSWARHFTPTVPLSPSTGELSGKPDETLEEGVGGWVTCYELASHPGEVAIIFFTSCGDGNQDKQRRCETLGSCVYITIIL